MQTKHDLLWKLAYSFFLRFALRRVGRKETVDSFTSVMCCESSPCEQCANQKKKTLGSALRARTLFQDQFFRTFPGLRQVFSSSPKCTTIDAINPYEIKQRT